MNTITISKKLIKNDDLVILPRKEYEQLFRFWASAESMLAPVKKAVRKGLREISEGKFLTSQQVKDARIVF